MRFTSFKHDYLKFSGIHGQCVSTVLFCVHSNVISLLFAVLISKLIICQHQFIALWFSNIILFGRHVILTHVSTRALHVIVRKLNYDAWVLVRLRKVILVKWSWVFKEVHRYWYMVPKFPVVLHHLNRILNFSPYCFLRINCNIHWALSFTFL